MRVSSLLESFSRKELLEFQTYLIEHLPSYVDVNLHSYGVTLSGDFEPIDIIFCNVGTSQAFVKVDTAYGESVQHVLGADWNPSHVSGLDLRTILRILNTNVGISKFLKWLDTEGFESKKQYDKTKVQRFEYFKLLPNNVKLLVSFMSSSSKDTYVQIGPNDENFNTRIGSRTRVDATTLKRLKQAVENAVDDYNAAYKKHADDLNLNLSDVRHLDEAKAHYNT